MRLLSKRDKKKGKKPKKNTYFYIVPRYNQIRDGFGWQTFIACSQFRNNGDCEVKPSSYSIRI